MLLKESRLRAFMYFLLRSLTTVEELQRKILGGCERISSNIANDPHRKHFEIVNRRNIGSLVCAYNIVVFENI